MADGDNYAAFADINAAVGFTIDAASKPNTTDLARILTLIDSKINGVFKVTTNITDTGGYLAAKEVEMAFKWVNNVMAATNPKDYGPMDLSFTADEQKEMRSTMSRWHAESFEVE